MIPWSPLARGRLTRDWDTATARTETDAFARTLYLDEDRLIVDEVAKIAAERGVSRAQVALAWVARNPVVVAPIIGATRPHLDEAVAALDLVLTDDEAARLEAPYRTRPVAGISVPPRRR